MHIIETDLEDMQTEDCRRPIPDKPVPTPINRASELMGSLYLGLAKQLRIQQDVTLADVSLLEARQNPKIINSGRQLCSSCPLPQRAPERIEDCWQQKSHTNNKSLMESRWKRKIMKVFLKQMDNATCMP